MSVCIGLRRLQSMQRKLLFIFFFAKTRFKRFNGDLDNLYLVSVIKHLSPYLSH